MQSCKQKSLHGSLKCVSLCAGFKCSIFFILYIFFIKFIFEPIKINFLYFLVSKKARNTENECESLSYAAIL